MPSWEVYRGLQVKAKSAGGSRRHSGQDQNKNSPSRLLLEIKWKTLQVGELWVRSIQCVLPTPAVIFLRRRNRPHKCKDRTNIFDSPIVKTFVNIVKTGVLLTTIAVTLRGLQFVTAVCHNIPVLFETFASVKWEHVVFVKTMNTNST